MAVQHQQLLPAGNTPEPHGAVEARRGEGPAIGCEGQVRHGTAATDKLESPPEGGEIPLAGTGTGAGVRQNSAVGGQNNFRSAPPLPFWDRLAIELQRGWRSDDQVKWTDLDVVFPQTAITTSPAGRKANGGLNSRRDIDPGANATRLYDFATVRGLWQCRSCPLLGLTPPGYRISPPFGGCHNSIRGPLLGLAPPGYAISPRFGAQKATAPPSTKQERAEDVSRPEFS